MTDFRNEKRLVRNYYEALDSSEINKITDARGRNLDFDEREKIIDELIQEFMNTGSFLNGLQKKTKQFPGDEDLV